MVSSSYPISPIFFFIFPIFYIPIFIFPIFIFPISFLLELN
uniref:Uncharacterized protein n=1 Tax=Myoviridae sp. ctdNl2 TaxID=2825140 RepID=A0A8S5QG14_9CAUD|nr:MAG TPA: hypothetical protein [Myoviridae sp. ctdNl2]